MRVRVKEEVCSVPEVPDVSTESVLLKLKTCARAKIQVPLTQLHDVIVMFTVNTRARAPGSQRVVVKPRATSTLPLLR